MEYQTLIGKDGSKFDIADIDRTIGEEFETQNELLSYLAVKYGTNSAQRILGIIGRCEECLQPHQDCTC